MGSMLFPSHVRSVYYLTVPSLVNSTCASTCTWPDKVYNTGAHEQSVSRMWYDAKKRVPRGFQSEPALRSSFKSVSTQGSKGIQPHTMGMRMSMRVPSVWKAVATLPVEKTLWSVQKSVEKCSSAARTQMWRWYTTKHMRHVVHGAKSIKTAHLDLITASLVQYCLWCKYLWGNCAKVNRKAFYFKNILPYIANVFQTGRLSLSDTYKQLCESKIQTHSYFLPSNWLSCPNITYW